MSETKRFAQTDRVNPAKIDTPTLSNARMLTVSALISTTTSAHKLTNTVTLALAAMAASKKS